MSVVKAEDIDRPVGRDEVVALVSSAYEAVALRRGPCDMLLGFAIRMYPQQSWIGEAMRDARANKHDSQQTMLEMYEAVVAEADRRGEHKIGAMFRGVVAECRMQLAKGE